jgi:hypothetical protein
MAQLPVAHAQNILPGMVTSGHVTDVTSGHVTSGHVTSGHVQWSDRPQMLTELYPYTTYISDIFQPTWVIILIFDPILVINMAVKLLTGR